MPARNIPLMRKGKDYIVLPGDFEPIREFAEFVQAVMDLDEDQVRCQGLRCALLWVSSRVPSYRGSPAVVRRQLCALFKKPGTGMRV